MLESPTKDGKEVWDQMPDDHKQILQKYNLVHPAMFTCCNCPFVKTCEYTYDPYNTDGDCLEEK